MLPVESTMARQGNTEEVVTFLRSIESHDEASMGWIRSVRISPGGSTIAAASNDGLIRVLDPSNGACIATLRGHTAWALCLAYSPDGSLLVSGSYDASIIVWDTGSWTQIGEPLQPNGGAVRDLAFHPAGGSFICACAQSTRITVWSSETFRQVGEPAEGHISPVLAVDFSPHGSIFASGCEDGSVGLWRTDAKALFRDPLQGHTGPVSKVKFSPNGCKLATASEDCTVRIWDALTGNPLAVFEGHTGAVQSLAFSLSSAVLISGSSDDSLRLWHVLKKYAIGGPVKHHTSAVTGIDCSRDGTFFVSSSYDHTICLWRLNSEVICRTGPPSLRYFSDGAMLDSAEDNGSAPTNRRVTKAVVSSPQYRNVLSGHTNWINSVAFSPDGSSIASGSDDKTVRIWPTDSDDPKSQPRIIGCKDVVHCIAFSPDGKTLASASRMIQLWDTVTGERSRTPLWGHTDKVQAVVFSHDGHRILSGGSDQTARIWDVEEGEEIGEPYDRHRDIIRSIDVTAKGLVASGSADATVHIWDMNTRLTIGGPLKGHTDEIRATKFSPDGMMLASASDDWTVRLWDVPSGTTIVVLGLHTSNVRSIAFSPDGSVLASCSVDQTVIFWDARRGTAIGPPLRYPEGTESSTLSCLDISADGKRVVAGSTWSKNICVWDIDIPSEEQPVLGALIEASADTSNAAVVLSSKLASTEAVDTMAREPTFNDSPANTPFEATSAYPHRLDPIAPSSESPRSPTGPAISRLSTSVPPASQLQLSRSSSRAGSIASNNRMMHATQMVLEDRPAQEASLGAPPAKPTAQDFAVERDSSSAPSSSQLHAASEIAEPASNPERLANNHALDIPSLVTNPVEMNPGVISASGTSGELTIHEFGAQNRRERDRVSVVTWLSKLSVRVRSRADDVDTSKAVRVSEQSERLNMTRRRVVRAANSVLGTTADVAHEALRAGVDLLELAPVPGLAVAGHLVLDIWDAVQHVQTNRTACQELTKRCADLLISVREEIVETGSDVCEELKAPIDRLHRAFQDVLLLMRKQTEMPFLKRYLAREKTLKEITHCDAALVSALDMFSLSVQLRTLKLMQSSLKSSFKIIGNRREPISRSKVAENLRALRAQQNDQDRIEDSMHLRQLLRAAVETHDDVAMVEILQVGRDEMPEAMSALERTLQGSVLSRGTEHGPEARLGRRESILSRVGVRRGRVPNAPSPPTESIDREFMQTGVEALRRLTLQHGSPHELPSWTITRYEIDLEQKIGIGFFSVVHKGTWRDRTVAIKMLADTTSKSLFIKEAALWKTFSHPNIVPLLGASSASSNPPWFFVSPYYKNGNLVKFLKDLPILHIEIILRCMQEIAAGMMYLHEHDVLHGDLKAVNVLVDDNLSCVITDFGQSEMRSEVFRLSRLPVSRGTLRWQAPELMEGASAMTREIDVYAYAITCIEVMTKGGLPWPLQDDEAVRRLVLVENQRPPLLSNNDIAGGQLYDIIQACWHRDPALRPRFSQIIEKVTLMRQS